MISFLPIFVRVDELRGVAPSDKNRVKGLSKEGNSRASSYFFYCADVLSRLQTKSESECTFSVWPAWRIKHNEPVWSKTERHMFVVYSKVPYAVFPSYHVQK